MNVLKFGGTSVGTVESLTNVRNIVESLPADTIVVVSALGGLTDKLIATARLAAEGGPWAPEADAIAVRHHHIIDALVREEKRESTLAVVDDLLEELRRTYEGVSLIGDLPQKTLDVIVSLGERMSAPIVAGIIKGARLHNSLDFIKTEKWFDKNIADTSLTHDLIVREFSDIEFGPHIAGGFISQDRDSGEITNLGRGGSDYTAALIAAALDADMLDIWTDVDGFMTADPRIIKDAKVLSAMSFVESMELCTFGAKVIYPPTIYPVFHKNIPIKILNTFNPEAPGTLVTDGQIDTRFPIKGVSTLRNTTLFTLTGIDNEKTGEVATRTLNALARHGIKIFLLNHGESRKEYTFGVAGADADETGRQILSEFAPELSTAKLNAPIRKDSLSTIAVVGEDMKSRGRLAGRIWHTLHRDGITVEAYSAGNSDTTITYVVDSDKADRALQLIHGLVFRG